MGLPLLPARSHYGISIAPKYAFTRCCLEFHLIPPCSFRDAMKHEQPAGPLIPFRLSTTCCPAAQAKTTSAAACAKTCLYHLQHHHDHHHPAPRPPTTASSAWRTNDHNPAAAIPARHSPHSGNDLGKSCRRRRRRRRGRLRLSRPRMDPGPGADGVINGGVGRCRRRRRGWPGAGIVVGDFVLFSSFCSFLFFCFVL